MFVSSFKLKGQAGKRNEIFQTINGISDQLRFQKGCLSVTSYQDTNDLDCFFLMNEWETQEDLNEYLSSKLFAVLLGIRTILTDTPEVRVLVEDCTYNCDEIIKAKTQ